MLQSTFCVGQDMHVVDSLRLKLATSNDKTKIDVLFELGRKFYDVDNEKALNYAEEARCLAIENGDSLQYVKTHRLTGQLLRRHVRLDEAKTMLSKVELIALRNGFNEEYRKITNALAIVYEHKYEFVKALRYNLKSLAEREKSGNEPEISIALNNIGTVYNLAGNDRKAVEYFEKSLKMKKNSNDKFDLDLLLINIGISYLNLGDLEKSRTSVMEGLKICGPHCEKRIQEKAMRALGDAFYRESKYDSAKKYYLISYTLSIETADVAAKMECVLDLARIALRKGDFKTGLNYLREIDLSPAGSIHPWLLRDAYEEMEGVLWKEKDYNGAERYRQKYKALQDTLSKHSLISIVEMADTEFEQRENRAKIETQKKIIALHEEVISTQHQMNIIIGFAFVLSIGFVGLLIYNIRQRKNVNSLLEARIKERTKELESSYDSLRRTSKERDHTLARAAREFKEPLLSLQGINAVAQREVIHPKASDYFQRTDAIIHQLLNLVNSFSSGS